MKRASLRTPICVENCKPKQRKVIVISDKFSLQPIRFASADNNFSNTVIRRVVSHIDNRNKRVGMI